MSEEKKGAPALESPAEKIARLEREMAELQSKLKLAEETIESKDAQAAAQLMFGSTVQEIPCGMREREKRDKRGDVITHKVKKLDGDGQPELDDDGKQMFVKEPIYEEVPIFKYKIDLPPSGGLGIVINQFPYYHGEVYEFDIDELRTIKDIVARSWGHEANIRGAANENAYRRPIGKVLRGNDRAH